MPFTSYATAGGASQARNPQRTYDLFGFTSGGLQVTQSGGTNALSSYSTLGTTTAALAGIELAIYNFSSSVPRYQVSLRIGGSTVIVPDLQVKQNTFGQQVVFIPIRIPTSTLVEVAIRTSHNANSCYFAARGVIENGVDAPGFANMEAILTVVTAATEPSATSVPDSDTWTELVASTSREYGALFLCASRTAAPTNAQRSDILLGTGAAASEVAFWRDQFSISTSNPYVAGGLFGPIEANVPASTRLSCKIIGPSSAPDSFLIGLWGLY